MKKGRIGVILCSLLAVLTLAFVINMPTAAASYVTEGDWISSSGLELKKCEGGECDHTECDYVYSFAFVGDTQSLNYRDVTEGNENMSVLYNWIVNNKEKYNIEYVMGLGDITESFNSTAQYPYFEAEWQNAKEAISLMDGRTPYSLVIGNHDNSAYLNKTFGVGNAYYNALMALANTNDEEGRAMAGFFDESKIEDTYRKIEVSGHKYIIFTLRRYAAESKDLLAWIGNVLEENEDYSAIITLHQFMTKDYTILDPLDKNDTSLQAYEKMLWDDCLSKYENVSMIISGHVDVDDIYSTQLRGDNGNTVTCMLIDGQEIDMKIENVGMVAMFYVSADGKVLNVEYLSSIRDTNNGGKDESEKLPIYLKEKNQLNFTLDYSTEEGDGWVATPYGYIPENVFYDEKYYFHIILDDDSDANTTSYYYGSYSSWEETLEAVHAWNGKISHLTSAAKVFNVVMSQDYTCSGASSDLAKKAGNNPGKMVLDLFGNNFTIDSGIMLYFYNKNASYIPEYTITDTKDSNGNRGELKIKNSGRAVVTLTEGGGNGGAIKLNFENLKITYLEGASGAIISNFSGGGKSASVIVNVNYCDVDSSLTSSSVTYFKLKDSNNNNHVSLTVKGGSFKGALASKTTLFSLNELNDKVTFAKDENGNYPTLTLDDRGVVSGVFYSEADDTYLSYSEGALSDGKYVYTLEKANVEMTEYGLLDTEKYPADEHPFVVFKNGEVIHTFSDWYVFISTDLGVNTELRSGCTVLLRKDYCVNDASGKANAMFRIGDMILDLGGHVITTGEKYLFQAIGRNDQGFESTFIKITNGTLKGITKYAPIVFNDNASSTAIENFDFLIEDVILDVSAGIGIARCYGDGNIGASNSITINNCTIYRDSNNKSVNMFMLSDTKNMLDIDVSISNTKLVASSLSGLTFANFNAERESGAGSPDKLRFGENFEIVLPSNQKPTSQYTFTDGTYCLAKTSVNGDTTVNYELYDVKNLATEYGNIDVEYASVVDHPFVVFKNGAVIYTFSNWYQFMHTDIAKSAYSELRSGCTVYMRVDYNTSDASGKASNLYWISDITFDLGGNTLTSGEKHLFQAIGKATADDNTYVKIINGTLASVAGGYTPIVFNDSASSTVVETFEFVLENVTFDLSSGLGIVKCYNDGSIGSKNVITLNDCTIYRDGENTSVTIFSLSDSKDILDIDVVVNGGKLVADSMSGITFAKFNTGKDTLLFGEKSDGSLFTIALSEETDAISGTYTTANGVECVFVKESKNTEYVNYSLYPVVMMGYKIKTSVTLWSNFVYNIYIPKANFNSVKFNGLAVDYEEVEIDGVLYYHVSVNLPAGEALSDFKLTVTLNTGATTVDANWTLDVFKYTKAVLAGEFDGTTKTLMKDMLVYASAAHTYFENTASVSDKLAEIATLLNGYSATLPTGEAKKPASNTYFTDVAVNVGAVPSFRFYLASGYTADNFTFKVGKRNAAATVGNDENGDYLEITMYAYMMLDDVTYTVVGTDVSESYNLYSYYAYATTTGNENLVAIVEALMKYSVSAKEYRDSVVNK